MDATCSNCKAQLGSSLWSFCPRCGFAIAHESPKPLEHEDVPARGAFGGLLYGLIAAPILLIAGTMLCLTGWGAVFGVPIMVMGILAPLAGPLFGMAEHKGKCPSCGITVLTVGDGKVHDCPACSAKFAVGSPAAAGAR